MEENSGFIVINRKMLEWEWYQDANTFRLFFHLIMKANWKDGRFLGHAVPRGSLVSSIGHLAEDLNLSVRNVRTSLEHLKSTGEIEIKTTNRFSLITVINYRLYQDKDSESTINRQTTDKQLTINRQTTDKQLTTIEQRNKETKKQRNNNNTPLTPQRGTEEIPIPTVLDFDRFKEAWRDWVAYRKEKRQTLKESTIKIQFRFLAEHSSDAVEIIEQSIRNGWTGLFELKQPRRTEPQPTKTVTLSERQRINEEFLREDG